jgi:hypothetical protein
MALARRGAGSGPDESSGRINERPVVLECRRQFRDVLNTGHSLAQIGTLRRFGLCLANYLLI